MQELKLFTGEVILKKEAGKGPNSKDTHTGAARGLRESRLETPPQLQQTAGVEQSQSQSHTNQPQASQQSFGWEVGRREIQEK